MKIGAYLMFAAATYLGIENTLAYGSSQSCLGGHPSAVRESKKSATLELLIDRVA